MAKTEKDFGGNIFKVWYNPQISQEFKKLLYFITPSMTSEQGDSNQFEVEVVLKKVKGREDTLCKNDQDFINILRKGKVQYIEL